MDLACDICGVSGFYETIVTCSLCKKASEHIYCMRKNLLEVPNVWYCCECEKVKKTTEDLGGTSCRYTRSKEFASEDTDLPMILLIAPEVKPPQYHAPHACWEGSFQIFDVVSQTYRGVQAHFPGQVSPKAFDITKQMQKNVKLEVRLRKDVWPRVFSSYPPVIEDVALFFFPMDDERPKEKYFRLVNRIDSRESALVGHIGGVRLLIFTSKQLPSGSQRTGAELYLWGIFHNKKHNKVEQYKQEGGCSFSPAWTDRRNTSTCEHKKVGPRKEERSCFSHSTCSAWKSSYAEKDMEVDMVERKAIGRIKVPLLTKIAEHKKGLSVEVKMDSPGPSDSPPGFSRHSNFDHGRTHPVLMHHNPNVNSKDVGGHGFLYSKPDSANFRSM